MERPRAVPSMEQETCVAQLLAGQNVTVQAAAGSGKSTTFYHAAAAWLASPNSGGTKILQLCFNVVLRAEAEKRVAALGLQDHIDCCTIHALAGKMFETRVTDTLSLHLCLKGNGNVTSPAVYSLCLVDEAQDLNSDHIAVINRLQTLFPMRFMVVGDPRQEIYAHARMAAMTTVLEKPEAHLQDNGHPWSTCRLTTSYRLTPPVCDFLNALMRHPSQVPIVAGNTVFKALRPLYVVGDRDALDIVDIVKEMLKRYKPEEIMILSPSVSTPKHRCQLLAKALSEDVPIFSTHKQRAEVTHDMLKGKLFLSTFHQAKGYERPCVIVLGVDAEEWALNDRPMHDDVPLVHNALHVACTRAQEQLVLFQHYQCAPYPTLTLSRVAAFAELRVLKNPNARPPKSSGLYPWRQQASWLVNFQPREILLQMLACVTLPEPQRCGPKVPFEPSHVALMDNQRAEDVWDYFPEAILSAVQSNMTKERTQMEQAVVHINVTLLPSPFKPYYQNLRLVRKLSRPQDWLAVSAIYNAMVIHDYPHELSQLCDFSWCTANDAEYFTQCVQTILAVLPSSRVFWNETSISKSMDEYKMTLQATARFSEWSIDGLCTPWQFCFDDIYTEANLMTAMVHLWLYPSNEAKIFCVPSNTMYVVKAPPPEALHKLIGNMIAWRRGVPIK